MTDAASPPDWAIGPLARTWNGEVFRLPQNPNWNQAKPVAVPPGTPVTLDLSRLRTGFKWNGDHSAGSRLVLRGWPSRNVTVTVAGRVHRVDVDTGQQARVQLVTSTRTSVHIIGTGRVHVSSKPGSDRVVEIYGDCAHASVSMEGVSPTIGKVRSHGGAVTLKGNVRFTDTAQVRVAGRLRTGMLPCDVEVGSLGDDGGRRADLPAGARLVVSDGDAVLSSAQSSDLADRDDCTEIVMSGGSLDVSGQLDRCIVRGAGRVSAKSLRNCEIESAKDVAMGEVEASMISGAGTVTAARKVDRVRVSGDSVRLGGDVTQSQIRARGDIELGGCVWASVLQAAGKVTMLDDVTDTSVAAGELHATGTLRVSGIWSDGPITGEPDVEHSRLAGRQTMSLGVVRGGLSTIQARVVEAEEVSGGAAPVEWSMISVSDGCLIASPNFQVCMTADGDGDFLVGLATRNRPSSPRGHLPGQADLLQEIGNPPPTTDGQPGRLQLWGRATIDSHCNLDVYHLDGMCDLTVRGDVRLPSAEIHQFEVLRVAGFIRPLDEATDLHASAAVADIAGVDGFDDVDVSVDHTLRIGTLQPGPDPPDTLTLRWSRQIAAHEDDVYQVIAGWETLVLRVAGVSPLAETSANWPEVTITINQTSRAGGQARVDKLAAERTRVLLKASSQTITVDTLELSDAEVVAGGQLSCAIGFAQPGDQALIQSTSDIDSTIAIKSDHPGELFLHRSLSDNKTRCVRLADQDAPKVDLFLLEGVYELDGGLPSVRCSPRPYEGMPEPGVVELHVAPSAVVSDLSGTFRLGALEGSIRGRIQRSGSWSRWRQLWSSRTGMSPQEWTEHARRGGIAAIDTLYGDHPRSGTLIDVDLSRLDLDQLDSLTKLVVASPLLQPLHDLVAVGPYRQIFKPSHIPDHVRHRQAEQAARVARLVQDRSVSGEVRSRAAWLSAVTHHSIAGGAERVVRLFHRAVGYSHRVRPALTTLAILVVGGAVALQEFDSNPPKECLPEAGRPTPYGRLDQVLRMLLGPLRLVRLAEAGGYAPIFCTQPALQIIFTMAILLALFFLILTIRNFMTTPADRSSSA